ncbi:MAG: Fur family transcriptional regulator [Actinomycetes bacterium]
MANDHDLHSTAAQRLRVDGQRYTSNRRALVGLLDTTDHPVTIAEVLELRSDLAQSSVYRNLSVLEDSGVVHRVVATDEFTRFELAQDLTEHHHHLICTTCGAVADFTIEPHLEASMDDAFAQVSNQTGFETQHHRLDLVGRCARCVSCKSPNSDSFETDPGNTHDRLT